MKKALKNILIVCIAVSCAFCMHLTVSAEPGGGIFGNVSIEDLSQMIQDLFTKPTDPDETETTTDPNVTTDPNATTDPNVTTDPVNNSGTGSVTTSTTEFTTVYVPNNGGNTYPTQPMPTTTEPAGDENEPTSFDYEGSLSDWLEADSAVIIVQRPSETYTIDGLYVNNEDDSSDSGFSWMHIAIVAAAIMFIILFALVVSLIVRRKRDDGGDDGYVDDHTQEDDDTPKGPVPVEVMTAERIAELLGSAKKAQNGYDSESSIRNAILMEQLTQSYSDPLIRKYTDEPVRMSPIANINENDNVSAADILKATDSMLDDITGNEKYASDVSGVSFLDDDIDNILENTETKVCPECNSPVSSSDIFCHSCGAYVG